MIVWFPKIQLSDKRMPDFGGGGEDFKEIAKSSHFTLFSDISQSKRDDIEQLKDTLSISPRIQIDLISAILPLFPFKLNLSFSKATRVKGFLCHEVSSVNEKNRITEENFLPKRPKIVKMKKRHQPSRSVDLTELLVCPEIHFLSQKVTSLSLFLKKHLFVRQ